MSTMINNLHWDTLEKRRQISCFLLMYRIPTQQIAIRGNRYLAPNAPEMYNVQMLPLKQISNHPSSHPGVQQLLLPNDDLVERPPREHVGSSNLRGLQRSCYHSHNLLTNLSSDLFFSCTLFILYSHLIHAFLAPSHQAQHRCVYTHWR